MICYKVGYLIGRTKIKTQPWFNLHMGQDMQPGEGGLEIS